MNAPSATIRLGAELVLHLETRAFGRESARVCATLRTGLSRESHTIAYLFGDVDRCFVVPPSGQPGDPPSLWIGTTNLLLPAPNTVKAAQAFLAAIRKGQAVAA